MEQEKKLPLLVEPPEVIVAKLRIQLPGVLRAVEELEKAQRIDPKIWDLTFGRV